MDPQQRLAIPPKGVAADVLDDEVVVVNLATGHYFSTDGVGCEVWLLLAAGLPIGTVVETLRDRYEGDGEEIDGYVAGLVDQILAAGLMVPADAGDAPPVGEVLPPVTGPRPFVPATFLGFDDMESLLLLDPVHDVDHRGWPHADPGA